MFLGGVAGTVVNGVNTTVVVAGKTKKHKKNSNNEATEPKN